MKLFDLFRREIVIRFPLHVSPDNALKFVEYEMTCSPAFFNFIIDELNVEIEQSYSNEMKPINAAGLETIKLSLPFLGAITVIKEEGACGYEIKQKY